MSTSALEGVVAMVSCRSHGYMDPTPVIHSKLRAMGAKVAQRFGKDITHIVFNRKLNPTVQERGLEDADLRMLHDKAAKMDYPVAIVTPLWVSQSQELGRRALEGHFMLARPAQPTATEQAIGSAVTPGSTKGKKGQGRRASLKLIKSDDLDLGIDLDSPMFSSSQQMKDVAGNIRAENGKASGRRQGGKGAGHTVQPSPAMKPLRERLLHGVGQAGSLIAVKSSDGNGQLQEPSKPQEAQPSNVTPRAASKSTASGFKTPMPRLAAPARNISGVAEVIDLSTPKGKRQCAPEDMCTPALSPCTSDSPCSVVPSSVPSSAKGSRRTARPRVAPLPLPSPAPIPCTSSISTPKLNLSAATRIAPRLAYPPAKSGSGSRQCGHAKISRNQPREASESASAGRLQAAVAQSVTFDSVEEAEPTGTDHMDLDIGPSTQQVADTLLDFGRDAVSNPLYQTEGPQMYGNALFAPEEPSTTEANATAATVICGASRQRAVDLTCSHSGLHKGSGKGAPSLWGAKRARSGVSPVASDPATAPQPPKKRQKTAVQSHRPAVSSVTAGHTASAVIGNAPLGDSVATMSALVTQKLSRRPSSAPRPAASTACSPLSSPIGVVSKGGLVASTSVSAAEADMLKAAVRKLRSGYRLCPDGRQPTHVVVGAERRTLKILQAIARGAWLMSPEWVTKSLYAGRWLPEEDFPAKVRFTAGAKRARQCINTVQGQQLLENHRIFVCDHTSEDSKIRSNAEVIRSLAAALGAQVVPARGCTLCITTGGTGRPTHVATSIPVVEEEWLFHSVEQYELLDMKKWLVDHKQKT